MHELPQRNSQRNFNYMKKKQRSDNRNSKKNYLKKKMVGPRFSKLPEDSIKKYNLNELGEAIPILALLFLIAATGT